jgi:hypothetical protein
MRSDDFGFEPEEWDEERRLVEEVPEFTFVDRSNDVDGGSTEGGDEPIEFAGVDITGLDNQQDGSPPIDVWSYKIRQARLKAAALHAFRKGTSSPPSLGPNLESEGMLSSTVCRVLNGSDERPPFKWCIKPMISGWPLLYACQASALVVSTFHFKSDTLYVDNRTFLEKYASDADERRGPPLFMISGTLMRSC